MRAEHVERRLDQQLVYADRIEHAHDRLIIIGSGNVTRHRIDARLQALKDQWEEFNVVHNAIFMSIRKVDMLERDHLEHHSYFLSNVYNDTYQIYLENLDQMWSLLKINCETRSTASMSQPTSIIIHVNSRLPRIDIPKFEGTFNNWLPFRDLFTLIVIGNNSISFAEKLQYLKTSLTGPTAELIENISLTSENFQKAWDSLVSFYENDRLLVQSAVSLLFSIKRMTRESAIELEQLYLSTLQAYRTLETLNRPVHLWDDILVHLTVNKLDAHLVRSWENYLESTQKPPSWSQLKDFMRTKMVLLKSLEKLPKRSSNSNNQRQHFKSHYINSSEDNDASSSSNHLTCLCCSNQHLLTKCTQFLSKTIKQRQEFIKGKRLCFNCLKQHFRSECKSSNRCLKCGLKHHTLLHQFQNPKPSTKQNNLSSAMTPSSSVPTGESTRQVNHLLSPVITQSVVLLATAKVRIIYENGTQLTVRALLDQGSEISLISENAVQRLQIPRKSSSIPMVGVGASKTGSTKGVVSIKLRPHFDSSIIVKCRAYILPKLTSRIPTNQLQLHQFCVCALVSRSTKL